MILLLSACTGGSYQIPVSERPQPKPLASQRYLVRQGDTLFSIAWRYGLDFKGLAQVNSISEPFIIKPGQMIRLSDKVKSADKAKVASRPAAS